MQNKNTTIIITLLAIIVIILVVIALKKPKIEVIEIPVGDTIYEIGEEKSPSVNSLTVVTPVSTTSTYKKHGFTLELPKGFIPKEYQGETGPTYSIELPGGWLVYITDATWWEKYNLVGQSDYLRDQKIGTTTFKVYRYTGQTTEFYYFRQGNVAYMFNGDVIDYMKTFKFVGWN